MKVGDLVRLKAYPEITGIIVKKTRTAPLYTDKIDVLGCNGAIRANRIPAAYEVIPVVPTL